MWSEDQTTKYGPGRGCTMSNESSRNLCRSEHSTQLQLQPQPLAPLLFAALLHRAVLIIQRAVCSLTTDRREQGKMANQEASYAEHGMDKQPAADKNKPKGMSFTGKLLIFLGFPTFVGILGLYMSYLGSMNDKDKKLSFDQDFVMPFLLALAMATVIGLQTGGYRQKEITPIVPWPKVKRTQKIVRKKKETVTKKND
jgi:hypothetical protein